MVRIYTPPVDVLEESDRYIVFVDLPGVNHENIKIYGDEKSIIIEAIRHIPHTGKYIFIERFSGKFLKKINFTSFINLSKAKAFLENGVLVVEIPKAADEFIIDTAYVKIILRR